MIDCTASPSFVSARLRSATVVCVQEEFCEIMAGEQRSRARYATLLPTPHVERLSPGHLVAVSVASDACDVVVWRWYDAVVLGAEAGMVRMWEPSHHEVLAQRRSTHQYLRPGSRAYLSAGLPGADWWVAGSTTVDGETADVELGEVERLYTVNDLWHTVV